MHMGMSIRIDFTEITITIDALLHSASKAPLERLEGVRVSGLIFVRIFLCWDSMYGWNASGGLLELRSNIGF